MSTPTAVLYHRAHYIEHQLTNVSIPLIGPLLVAFGGLLSVGDIIVVGLTVQQHYKKQKEEAPRTAVKMTPA